MYCYNSDGTIYNRKIVILLYKINQYINVCSRMLYFDNKFIICSMDSNYVIIPDSDEEEEEDDDDDDDDDEDNDVDGNAEDDDV